jgi:hypothetical protein
VKNALSKPAGDNDRRYWLRVSNHNFHDATLEQIRIVPARDKRQKAQIEVLLSVPHVGLRFSLTFLGCTNVSLAMDFDVLADQLPYNTGGHTALCDPVQIQHFIMSPIEAWNVQYNDAGSRSWSCDSARTSPLRRKIAKVASLHLHRVTYFGGVLSITARSHKVRRSEFHRNDSKG